MSLEQKISAIVPVYNTEKLVRRCIESVIAQTYPNWELILVDDGSTDGSLGVLSEYENKDSRIKVIHQDNAGPGLARNKGIENASGDYIVFIDSDDYIDAVYFELLAKHDEDVVFIDVVQKNDKGMVLRDESFKECNKMSKEAILRRQMTGAIPWGGTRKAAKIRLFRDYDICYSADKVGEEALLSFMLLYYASSIGFLNRTVYTYYVHDGSLSTTKIDDPWGNVVKEVIAKIKKMDVYEQYADTLNSFIVSATAVSMRRIANYYPWNEYKHKARNRLNEFKEMVDKKYSIDQDSLRKEAKMMYPLMYFGLKKIIYIIAKIYG